MKFVASNCHAADHLGTAIFHDGFEFLKRLSGFEGVRAIHRSLFSGEERDLRKAALIRWLLSKEEKAVGPAANDYEICVGK